jgi:hypothetical protein
MADPLSPQVGGGILFCACEANVSVANKAEALRRRCCCCKGLPHGLPSVLGSALRSSPLSRHQSEQLTAVSWPIC